jgi:hypothetical protein
LLIFICFPSFSHLLCADKWWAAVQVSCKVLGKWYERQLPQFGHSIWFCWHSKIYNWIPSMICQLRLEKKRKKESETFLLLFKKPSSRLCNSLLSCMDITTPQARQDRIKKLLPSNHSYQLFHNLFHNYLLLYYFFFFLEFLGVFLSYWKKL